MGSYLILSSRVFCYNFDRLLAPRRYVCFAAPLDFCNSEWRTFSCTSCASSFHGIIDRPARQLLGKVSSGHCIVVLLNSARPFQMQFPAKTNPSPVPLIQVESSLQQQTSPQPNRFASTAPFSNKPYQTADREFCSVHGIQCRGGKYYGPALPFFSFARDDFTIASHSHSTGIFIDCIDTMSRRPVITLLLPSIMEAVSKNC